MDKLSQLNRLIDEAEELLTRLADAPNPDIRNLRDRVDRAVNETKNAIADKARDVAEQIEDIANTVDDYIREYPWIVLAAGIVVTGTLAFWAGTALGAKKSAVRQS